jgi:hypothetical protein
VPRPAILVPLEHTQSLQVHTCKNGQSNQLPMSIVVIVATGPDTHSLPEAVVLSPIVTVSV